MNKTALITGGSSGIGFELANIFGANNYDLVLVANDLVKLKKSADDLTNKKFKVKIIAKDLSEPASPTEIYEFLQNEKVHIDILVNSAGFATYGPFAVTKLERELSELQVNIVALTHLTKLILPDMIKNGSGKILNMASIAAFAPGPLMAVYYASKAYVLSFSEALNEELRNSGVHVSALCPGPTDTDFAAQGGLKNSKLFKGKNMTASFVAQAAYKGLLDNQTVIIPGLQNKLLVQALRFTPRGVVTKVIKNIQSKR